MMFDFDGFHCKDCDYFDSSSKRSCVKFDRKRWPGDKICDYFTQENRKGDNQGVLELGK